MSPGRTPAGRCTGRRIQGQRVTRPALSPVGLPTTMHSVVGRVHSRPALFRNSMLALTQLGVITDTCRWTLPVPLTPLRLRSDASRRSGRGSVRVPSGPRPRALQFFGLFGWGGAHRLPVSRPQRCCTTLCGSSAFLSPSSPLLRGHVGHCSAPALRSSPAVEHSGLPLPPHGRLPPGPPAQNPQSN